MCESFTWWTKNNSFSSPPNSTATKWHEQLSLLSSCIYSLRAQHNVDHKPREMILARDQLCESFTKWMAKNIEVLILISNTGWMYRKVLTETIRALWLTVVFLLNVWCSWINSSSFTRLSFFSNYVRKLWKTPRKIIQTPQIYLLILDCNKSPMKLKRCVISSCVMLSCFECVVLQEKIK